MGTNGNEERGRTCSLLSVMVMGSPKFYLKLGFGTEYLLLLIEVV